MKARAEHLFAFVALVGFSECAATKTAAPRSTVVVDLPPPLHGPPAAPPTRAEECQRIQSVVADVMTNTDAAAGAKTLETLHDELTTPKLAEKIAALARTEHGLALAMSFPALDHAARGGGESASAKRALFVATRTRELARRAALADCVDDGSRDQSAAWQDDTVARMRAFASTMLPCLEDELKAHPDENDVDFTLHLKAYILPNGHVSMAGPDAPYPLPGTEEHPYSSDLDYCAMKALEGATFMPPVDNAIIAIPFVHSASNEH